MENIEKKLNRLPRFDRNDKTRVAIAMSGGVDSAVAAKLLKDQGYDVVGFMMKLWSDPSCPATCPRENACCDDQGVLDAQKVADILKIPFYVVNAKEIFKKEVADYFVEEYKNLRTPNPCVVCNNKIKFGWLLDFAKKTGCEYLATGHYARIVNDSSSSQFPVLSSQLNEKMINDQINENCELSSTLRDEPSGSDSNEKNVNYHLLRGKDDQKDQSYFLYGLNQEQLSQIMFPVGGYTKEEVRAMAKKWDLPVFAKRESQEICFIQDKDFRDFLRRKIPAKYFEPGKIVDKEGNVLGEHTGLINYTIGQRKNVNQELGIMNHGKDRQPLYVVGFDREKNQLIVGNDDEVFRDKMELRGIHFVRNKELGIRNNEKLQVKIRYRHPAVCGEAIIHDSQFIIQFKEPQRAITPGQSAVFYDGDEVLGGGIIV